MVPDEARLRTETKMIRLDPHTSAVSRALVAQTRARDKALRGFFVTGTGFYQGACHVGEPASRTAASQALNVDTGSFKQKEQLLRQSLRFHESGVSAELRKALSLLLLGFFDDDASGMAFFRKFDRGIRHRTAAKIRITQIVSDPRDQCAKLCIRIPGMSTHDFFVSGDRIGVQGTEIFRHQQILRFEMAVQRHLVGLRSSGDLIDTDGADSPAIKQVTGCFENPFARRCLGLFCRLRGLLQNLPLGRLTRYLPVSNITNVTNQYHDRKRMSRVLFFEGKRRYFKAITAMGGFLPPKRWAGAGGSPPPTLLFRSNASFQPTSKKDQRS